MLRREVVKMAGGLFGLGKPQPSRFPYKDRPQPSPGIAPSPGIVVKANKVIVFGPSGTPVGVFVYQPGTTPALGNPPVEWMSESTVDPFGNVLPFTGVVSKSGTSISVLHNGEIFVGDTSYNSPAVLNGNLAPGGEAQLSIQSPLKASTDNISNVIFRAEPTGTPAKVIFGGSAGTTVAFNGGGTVSVAGPSSFTGFMTSPDGFGWGAGGITAKGLTAAANGVFAAVGNVDVQTAGNGLAVAEGANAKQGTAVLVAGTATVANTSVTANSRIMLTSQVDGGTPGFLRVSARTAGTSFTIKSGSATDTSTVAYEIFEPG